MKLNKEKLEVSDEAELIVKIPREMLDDFEQLSKERGFENSREFLANFVKKQLGLFYKVEKDSFRLKGIH